MKNYNEYLKQCFYFSNVYPIGSSELNNTIYKIRLGNSTPNALVIGGIHAREYITEHLLFMLMKTYNAPFSIDFIPCLNIDGSILSEGGIDNLCLTKKQRAYLLQLNGSDDFSLWKANAKGVDINVNFDAGWGKGKTNKIYPSSSDYIGEYPNSARETLCAINTMFSNNYTTVICLHSKGNEVYYGYNGNNGYHQTAKTIADNLRYTLKTTPHSHGGLKDYWISRTNKFGLTIEVGEDIFQHPYPLTEVPNLAKRCNGLLPLIGQISKIL